VRGFEYAGRHVIDVARRDADAAELERDSASDQYPRGGSWWAN